MAGFDRVFLLSTDEAKKYFPSDDARCAELISESTGTTPIWWWLRSPGSSGRLAADVTDDGAVDAAGFGVDDEYLAVRPAMWIDISNL